MEGRARNERGAISQKTQTLQIQILADSTVTVKALGGELLYQNKTSVSMFITNNPKNLLPPTSTR